MTAPIPPINQNQQLADLLEQAMRRALSAERKSAERTAMGQKDYGFSNTTIGGVAGALGRFGSAVSGLAGTVASPFQAMASGAGFQYTLNPLDRQGQLQNLANMTGTALNYQRATLTTAAATGVNLERGGLAAFQRELDSVTNEFRKIGRSAAEGAAAIQSLAQVSLRSAREGVAQAGKSTSFFEVANGLAPGSMAMGAGTILRYGSQSGMDQRLRQAYGMTGGGPAAGELVNLTAGFVQSAALMGSSIGDRSGGIMAGINTLANQMGGKEMMPAAAQTLRAFQGAFQNDLMGFAFAANPDAKDPLEVLAAVQSGDPKELGKAFEAMGSAKEGVLRQMGMSGQVSAKAALTALNDGNYEELTKSLMSDGGPGKNFDKQAEAAITSMDKTIADFTQTIEKSGAAQALVNYAEMSVRGLKRFYEVIGGGDMVKGATNTVAAQTGVTAVIGAAAAGYMAYKLPGWLKGAANAGKGAVTPSPASGGGGPTILGPNGQPLPPSKPASLGARMKGSVTRGTRSLADFARGVRTPATRWNRIRGLAGSVGSSLTKGGVKGVLGRAVKGGIGGVVASVAGGFAIDSAVENGLISGRTGDALQGALSWGGTAAMTGNPLVMGAAALVGGVKGYFSGPNSGGGASVAAGNMYQNAASNMAEGTLTKIHDRLSEMVELIRSGKSVGSSGIPVSNEPMSLRHSGFNAWSTNSMGALAPSSRQMFDDAISTYQLPISARKVVTNTFRNEEANQRAGGVKNSLHMSGDAMDLQILDAQGKLDVATMNRMKADFNKRYGNQGMWADVHDVGSGMHLHMENQSRGNGRNSDWNRELLMEIAKASRDTAQASMSLVQNSNIFSNQRPRYQP